MICKKSTFLLLGFSVVSLFAEGRTEDSFSLSSGSPIELDHQKKEFKELKADIIKKLDVIIEDKEIITAEEKRFDWSEVDDFLNIKGKKLGCEKLPGYLHNLIAKRINPVQKFKETIEKDALLKEAVVRTIFATQEALEILSEIAKRDFQDTKEIEKILQKEPFSCAKRGINLILRALLELGSQKKYFDEKDRLNFSGKIFIASINGIIRHSINNSSAKSKLGESNILTIFNEIKNDKASFDLAIAKLEEFWTDPKNIIKLIFEIRVLTADVFFDMPSLRDVDVIRSTDEVFNACEKMLEEKKQALHRSLEAIGE